MFHTAPRGWVGGGGLTCFVCGCVGEGVFCLVWFGFCFFFAKKITNHTSVYIHTTFWGFGLRRKRCGRSRGTLATRRLVRRCASIV